MKIALINPELVVDKVISSAELDIGENIGLGILASVLRENDVHVELFDIMVKNEWFTKAIDSVVDLNPDLIGVTLMSQTYSAGIEIIRLLKSQLNKPIVVGGILPTILKEKLLYEFDPNKNIDYLIYGDGEVSLVELANLIRDRTGEAQKIKGLIWRDRGQIIVNEYRPLLCSLDSIPFPARDTAAKLVSLQKRMNFEPSLRIISSRGCYGNCLFCHIAEYYKSTNQKPTWRYRSVDNIISELSYLKKEFDVNRFLISDDNFFGYGKTGKLRALEFAKTLKRRNLNIKFCIQARLDSLDIEILSQLKDVGLISIDVGVETISPEVLKIFNKNLSLKTIINKFNLLSRLENMHIGVYMLNIHPFSTIKETKWNYEFLNEIGHFNGLTQNERDKEVYRKLIATRLEVTKYTRAYNLLNKESLLRNPFRNNPVMIDFIIRDDEMKRFYYSCLRRVREEGTEGFGLFFEENLYTGRGAKASFKKMAV